MSEPDPSTPPSALLLLAPGCAYCPRVLESLATLIKETSLSRMEVVNILAEPETARALGVRSVPWTRIGTLELPGLYTTEELRHWAEVAGRPDALGEYFSYLLGSGQRASMAARLRRHPQETRDLVGLLGDEETGIDVRLGVIATLEEQQGAGLDAEALDVLEAQLRHASARVRTDACHALAVAGGEPAREALRRCLADPSPEVRETAREGLAELDGD